MHKENKSRQKVKTQTMILIQSISQFKSSLPQLPFDPRLPNRASFFPLSLDEILASPNTVR